MNSTSMKVKGKLRRIIFPNNSGGELLITDRRASIGGIGGLLMVVLLFLLQRLSNIHILDAIAVPLLFSPLVVRVTYKWVIKAGPPPEFVDLLARGIFGFCLASCVTTAIVTAPFRFNHLFYELPGKYLNWLAVPILPIGYIAYHFKQQNQRWYGITEVIVGIVTGFGATAKPTQYIQFSQVLGLFAAMYIVARGFNNIHDAKDKAAEKEELVISQAAPVAP